MLHRYENKELQKHETTDKPHKHNVKQKKPYMKTLDPFI